MDQSHFNTIEETRKSGRHLSLEERGMIQALHRKGYSLRSIAAEVNCAHTTVFYELRRGTPEKRGSRVCLNTQPNAGRTLTSSIERTPESPAR